jgi:hypothetical protein
MNGDLHSLLFLFLLPVIRPSSPVTGSTDLPIFLEDSLCALSSGWTF